MKRLVYLVLMMISFIPLYSQKSDVKPVYSLEQCIEIAMRNNYDIKLATAKISSANADVTNAFGYFLPTLNFNSGYQRDLNPKTTIKYVPNLGFIPSTDPNYYSMNATSNLVIFDGFSRGANYTRAEENYNTITINVQYTQLKIKLDVYKNYLDVVRNSQVVKVRKENLEQGKKELERLKAQSDAGVIEKSALYTQEAELGNKEYDLVIAENNVNVAKAKLLASMGLAPDLQTEFLESSIPTTIDDEVVSNFRKQIGSSAEIVDMALNTRLDYQAQKSVINASKASLISARSAYYPSLSAGGSANWSNPQLKDFDKTQYSVGLNLSVPIFENFSTDYRLETAKLQVQQSEIQQSQLEQSIRSGIKTALLNLESSEKQIEISKRALTSSERNYEFNKERFRVGSSSVTDYLIANTQYIISQINRINAVYNYLQAQKELMFAIGKF